MNELVDVRVPLAASPGARVELGQDGVLHVLTGPIALSLDRAACEELTTTLARAMVRLARMHPRRRTPQLTVVEGGQPSAAREEDLDVP